MAFSFKIDQVTNQVTVTCDDSTPSNERIKIIDELVEKLIDNPSMNILLDVSIPEEEESEEESEEETEN